MTKRPLPDHDAELDRLSDEQRKALAGVWLGRAASERRVADAFVVVRDAFLALGSHERLVALATRAIDDEHRHARLSRLVASRFAGRTLEPPARLALVVPAHAGAPPRILHALHIIGHCALNETFASAFLEVSLRFVRGELAGAALRELLSDEIDHARLGWAHLGELDVRTRDALGPWLPAMVRANLKMWRESARPYPTNSELHGHGAPPVEAVEQALLGAVAELIIPGLECFGLPTTRIRDWLEAGAPTSGDESADAERG